jgi:hypothetical protein
MNFLLFLLFYLFLDLALHPQPKIIQLHLLLIFAFKTDFLLSISIFAELGPPVCMFCCISQRVKCPRLAAKDSSNDSISPCCGVV